MAIQVGGTTVINNSRQLQNVASVDATTVATLNAAGIGGASGVAGITWSTVVSGTTKDIDSTATDGSNTWVAVGQDGLILRSTDNASTWSTVSHPAGFASNFSTVNYADGVWIIGIYATSGQGSPYQHYHNFLRSTNGGATWAYQAHNGNMLVEQVAGANDGTWIATGGGGQYILRSTNDGVSWTRTSFGNDFQCRGVATDNNDNWVVTDGYYVRIRTSTDDGATWTARTVGSGTGLHYAVASGPSNEWVLTGTGGTFRSTNLTTWTTVPSAFTTQAFFYDTDVGAYIMPAGANVLSSSTDGFQTSSTSFAGISANAVRGNNNGTFVGVGQGGKLYRGTI